MHNVTRPEATEQTPGMRSHDDEVGLEKLNFTQYVSDALTGDNCGGGPNGTRAGYALYNFLEVVPLLSFQRA
jgi:hypothetical protein